MYFAFLSWDALAAAESKSKSAHGAKFSSRKIVDEGVCVDDAV